MELAVITLENTVANQERSRQIRDLHKKKGQTLAIRFSEELTHIILEAPCLYIPDQEWLDEAVGFEGIVKKSTEYYELHPRTKGKTVNLHLDSELAAELELIRSLVSSKTQQEVLRELFVRGMRSYLAEKEATSSPISTKKER
ncbi:hypothetical protein ABER61_19435 [Brevibacillus formosus]|uniref:Uncharacterized protein n=1 Tax=Brevibacillus formosus TaxID=54913 RepID=A0A837KUD8_9BACL|nr:hypothetical protein [Brevibacillus formosus]KLI00572.1 hypothetical protein AA984_01280 [Brevibacillus formosus]MED1958891.1 hypothetical protein [Brevibacillus formosus]PSJ92572.1 hypothetical protein C7R91_23645 [Brevibacillus formosus]GED57963.1 hypothetical protein BFO01nite_20950 [Brevibacillus formosus]